MSKHLKALIPGAVAAIIVGSLALLEYPATVLSNYTAVQSGSTTFQSFDNAGVKSPGFVPVDGTGVEKATTANPWVISSATPMPISANSQTLFRISSVVVEPVNVQNTVTVTGTVGVSTSPLPVSPTVVAPINIVQGGNTAAVKTSAATGSDSGVVVIVSPLGQNPNGISAQTSSAPVVLAPAPSKFHLIAAGTSNSTVVKASPGTFYGAQLGTISTAAIFVKLYDKASAPSCNSDTVAKTMIIPAATTGGGSNVSIPGGVTFSTGIALCAVAGILDSDATNIAASATTINIDFQ